MKVYAWCLYLSTLLVSAQGLTAQQPPRDPPPVPIPRAAGLSDLRVRTDQERRFAAVFDRPGPRITPDGTVDLGWRNVHSDEMLSGVAALDSSGPLTRAQRLAGFACGSDTFVGSLHSRRVLLSTSETTLFTLTTVDVERWFIPVSGPAQVVVAFPGGRVRIGEETYNSPGVGAPTDGRYVFTTWRLAKSFRTELGIGNTVPIVDGQLTIAGISGKADAILAEMATGVKVCLPDDGK